MNQLKIILATFVILLGAYGFIQSQNTEAISNSKIGLKIGDQAPVAQATVSPLLVSEWRNGGHSEWRCMVVEMSDMHCSTVS